MPSASAQCQYEVTAVIEAPLCPFGIPGVLVGTGMNNLGHVTGSHWDCFTGGHDHGFFWTPETGVVTMHKPTGVWRVNPTDISDNGLIVGTMQITSLGQRGFVYDMHTQQYIATLEPLHPLFGGSALHAINNNGIAVGSRSIGKPGQNPNPYNAVVWDTNTGEVIDLGVGSGPNSSAMDISENGEYVVGWANGLGPNHGQAAIWTNGHLQAIGPLPGTDNSIVNAVNESGVAVGSGLAQSPVVWRAFIWDGSFTIIDGADGWQNARGQEINDLGQAFILFSNPNQFVPLLWQHGEMHHLNSLLVDGSPNVQLTGTGATNNQGQILCSASTRAVLLTPANRPLTDLNADCATDVHDLLMLLDAWGRVPRGSNAAADFNGDGVVNVSDLLILLSNWGPR